MPRTYAGTAAAALLATLISSACSDPVTSPDSLTPPVIPHPSNGFPDNGKATLYKMNIIGHPGTLSSGITGGEGKRIFVRLQGNTRILLSPGVFDILDANGTDGTASFQLPDPDPDGDGQTWYGVYVRTKGKPFTGMNMTTCGTGDFDNDPTTPDEELCSLEVAILVRNKGKPSVDNVSRQLLSMCVDTDGDLTCDERIFLFDDRAHDYLWSVDNNGLRNAEVRFLELVQDIGLTP
jgi:hypothetical protein